MRLLVVFAAFVLLATAGIAQQAKGKAPAGCITCEQMCEWCASTGKQDKKSTAQCREGCRRWGGMVGVSPVYVHKKQSLCGTGNYAPRCN